MSSLIYIEALEIMRRFFLKKDRANPGLFSFIFGLFKQTSLNFLQQINVKKYHVHPGLRPWDLNPRPSEPEPPPITTRPSAHYAKVCM